MDKIDLENFEEIKKRLTPEYLAGFFDGEGSVSARIRDGVHSLIQVDLVQVGRDGLILMSMVAAKFGGGPYMITRTGNRKTVFRCGWNGISAKPILEYIKDHVILKKQQVEAALEFIDLIGPQGRTPSNDVRRKRTEIVSKITSLNDATRSVKEKVQ